MAPSMSLARHGQLRDQDKSTYALTLISAANVASGLPLAVKSTSSSNSIPSLPKSRKIAQSADTMENPWLCYLCFRRLSSYRSAHRHMEECHHVEKDYIDGVDGGGVGRIMTLSDNLKEGNNVEQIAWGCFDPDGENYWGILQGGVVIRERRRIGTHAAVENASLALINYRLRTNMDNYPDGKALGIVSGELAVIAQAALEVGESLEMGLKSLKRPQTEAQWIAKLEKQRTEYDNFLALGNAKRQKRQQGRKQKESLDGKRKRSLNDDGGSTLPASKAAKPQITQSFGYQTNQPLGYRTNQPFGCQTNQPIGYGPTQPIGYKSTHYVDYESTRPVSCESAHNVDCKFAQPVDCKFAQPVDYKSTQDIDDKSTQSVNDESTHSIDAQSTLPTYPESPLPVDPRLYLPFDQLMAISIDQEPTVTVEPRPSEEEELAQLREERMARMQAEYDEMMMVYLQGEIGSS